jgi:hypothetical protein
MSGKPKRPTCAPEEILDGLDPKVVALANRLRRLVQRMIDGVSEAGDPKARQIGLRRHGAFAFIRPMEDHVRLGFAHGAALPDFAGLLEGDGAKLRHVSIRSARAAGSIALKTLLSAALFDDETHGFRKRQRPRR